MTCPGLATAWCVGFMTSHLTFVKSEVAPSTRFPGQIPCPSTFVARCDVRLPYFERGVSFRGGRGLLPALGGCGGALICCCSFAARGAWVSTAEVADATSLNFLRGRLASFVGMPAGLVGGWGGLVQFFRRVPRLELPPFSVSAGPLVGFFRWGSYLGFDPFDRPPGFYFCCGWPRGRGFRCLPLRLRISTSMRRLCLQVRSLLSCSRLSAGGGLSC
jgi:hypothetical protein